MYLLYTLHLHTILSILATKLPIYIYVYIINIYNIAIYHCKRWSKKSNEQPYRIQSHWIGGFWVPNAIREKEPRAARHI